MSQPTGWPSAAEYTAAVQDADQCLVDGRLKRLVFALNSFDLPIVKSGQTAAVFAAEEDGRRIALRLFTAPSSNAERYRALDAHLTENPCPLFVEAAWIDSAVAYGFETYPAVVMPWVNGLMLSRYIDEAIESDEVERLAGLVPVWDNAMHHLEQSGLVHGDLQHGNIMVDTQDGHPTLRLIDYDGVCLPGTECIGEEVGQPNYQHPARLEGANLGGSTDTFSALVIAVSLAAVSADPTLWPEFHTGENLIFTHEDFVSVDSVSRPVWARVTSALEGYALLPLLKHACRTNPADLPQYSELIRSSIDDLQSAGRYVPNRSGRVSGTQWWSGDEGMSEAADQNWLGVTPSPAPTVDGTRPAATPLAQLEASVHVDFGGQPDKRHGGRTVAAVDTDQDAKRAAALFIAIAGLLIGSSAIVLLLVR